MLVCNGSAVVVMATRRTGRDGVWPTYYCAYCCVCEMGVRAMEQASR